MRREQIVNQLIDLVQRQLRRGVRIEHRRVIDMLAVACQRRLDNEPLHSDIAAL